ncbi:MAG: hypothetical protein H0W86_03620 [Armatimonadetes bacterium]|nr:hypothetical protein [Armatimonadota bacterium]
MKPDWKQVEAGKKVMRKRLASLTYSEKLRLLDRMRERDLLLRRAKPSPQR